MRGAVRDGHRHHGPAAFVGRNTQGSAAHDLEPLLNVFQGNARLAVIGGVKTAAVVRNDDLTAGIRFSRTDGNVKRAGIRISAVLDGVLHDGLQGQRRHAEPCMRRVVRDV